MPDFGLILSSGTCQKTCRLCHCSGMVIRKQRAGGEGLCISYFTFHEFFSQKIKIKLKRGEKGG